MFIKTKIYFLVKIKLVFSIFFQHTMETCYSLKFIVLEQCFYLLKSL